MLTNTHRKEYSQDSLLTRRRKFLSLVSCSLGEPKPPIKSVADLKRQAMGHKPTKSFCEAKGITLRIRRTSNQTSPKNEAKRKVSNLVDLSDYPGNYPASAFQTHPTRPSTPINRLLGDSHLKENLPF
jgi:hypothetical protein